MKIQIKRKKRDTAHAKGVEYTQVYVNNEFIGQTRNWRRNCWEVSANLVGTITATKTRDDAIAALLMHHFDPAGFAAAEEARDAA